MKTALKALTCTALSILAIAGCSPGEEEGFTLITVNPEEYGTIDLSEYSPMSLESDWDTPSVGMITRAEATGHGYYLSSMGKLVLFGSDGSLKGNIGNTGRAGNEYIGCSSFCVRGDEVAVVDFNGHKLMKFSGDGKYICSQDMEQGSISELTTLGDGWLCRFTFKGGGPEVKAYALGTLDREFNFKGQAGDLVLTSAYNLAGLVAEGADGSALFWNGIRNTVYRVTPDGQVHGLYRITFGDYDFPAPEKDAGSEYDMQYDYQMIMNSQKPEWAGRHAGLISRMHETPSYLMFTYSHNGDTFIARYDKKKHRTDRNVMLQEPDGAGLNGIAFDKDGGIHVFVDTDTATDVYRIKL